MSDQVSNKRQSFVKKKKKSNDTRHGFTVVDRSHCTHLLYTLNAFKWSLLFKWILPPYGARIKYISHECTLQDYHSSYEMEFQVYIYIYTYTRNKSLAPFMTFLHRSIDRLYRAPIYRESHSLTFRMKRHIPWSEWYYGVGNESTRSGGENLLFTFSAWNESNKTNFLIGWK